MGSVFYKNLEYNVDEYNRLILSGLEIKDLSEIKDLGKLKNVKSLSLQNNNISEIKFLNNFVELETLYLYNNQIKEIKNLEGFRNLKTLILSSNKIRKIEGLGNLENLIELSLSENQIEEIEEFESLTKLEKLDLHGNNIAEIKGLGSLKNLRILILNDNNINEITGIDHLLNLHKLYLDGNDISEIKGLENLGKLITLRINNNPIPKEILKDLELIDGTVYNPQKAIEYCIQQKEQELLEKEKIGAEPSEEYTKAQFIEFNSKFKILEKEWNTFTTEDTYLTYDKKDNFLKRLKEISKFSWYNRLRHPLKLKKINEKVKTLEKKLLEYNPQFIKDRLQQYNKFFDGKEYGIKYPLDLDQRIAVIKDDKHNLVIAGAGSGKTSVITNRIAYLLKRKDNIQEDKILALAFTNVAAKEMRERLLNTYGIAIDISTFHALGRNVIQDETNRKPILIKNENEIIKELFHQLLENKEFQDTFLEYLSYHSEEGIQEDDFIDKELYYKYMRNKNYSTLNNIIVKSISERNIGNFLFRHDIKFHYEPLVTWVDEDEEEEREYHPDFYLPDFDIYIEHWGLNKELRIPKWFTITSEEYQANREWKLDQFKKHQKILVETWEYERQEGTLIENLKLKLIEINPDIKFVPLSYVDLINKTYEFEVKKNDILNLISSFIRIAKSNFLMEDDIAQRLKSKTYTINQAKFGHVALQIYIEYQKYLRKERKIDFNDMINLAIELIKRNPEKYLSMYDHILIDEFQDISYQRMELINCLVNDKSNTKLFCVGDDWQSIYQFTGSEVSFFVNFGQYFAEPEITYLSNNYRSVKNIVELSNYVISHNKNQVKKEINSKTTTEIRQIINFIIADRLNNTDKISPPLIFALITSLLDNGANPEEIMVISRFNYNLRKAEIFCGANGILIEEKGPRGLTKGVRFYSAHKSKGTESKYVILSDLTSGMYGFPCEIQDSSVFEVAKRFVAKNFVEEERRLFYVALTRSKQYLFLLSKQGNQSMFLGEITPFIHDINIPSEEVWAKITTDFIPKLIEGKIGKQLDKPFFCGACAGVLLEGEGMYGRLLKCSNYPQCRYTFYIPENESETCPKCKRKLVERQGKYGKFLWCTGHPKCNYEMDLSINDRSITCPDCGKRLIVKKGKYGRFISCIGYPQCKFALNPSKRGMSRIECPLCGSPLAPKSGKYGKFLGCVRYPHCKFTFST